MNIAAALLAGAPGTPGRGEVVARAGGRSRRPRIALGHESLRDRKEESRRRSRPQGRRPGHRGRRDPDPPGLGLPARDARPQSGRQTGRDRPARRQAADPQPRARRRPRFAADRRQRRLGNPRHGTAGHARRRVQAEVPQHPLPRRPAGARRSPEQPGRRAGHPLPATCWWACTSGRPFRWTTWPTCSSGPSSTASLR